MAFTVNTSVPPIRNTSATLMATNPIFLKGQAIYETDTGRGKVGDGLTTYTNLTYPEWTYEEVLAVGTDTYTASFSKDILLVYFNMMRIRVKFTNANTGASTINLNGLGAIAIKKTVTAALVSGDILAGGIYDLTYDGTNFQMLTTSASGGGTVTSVSGTANRITSTGGATPAIDIAATYVGQASITTLGTITTGVWTGTDIALADGGTGASLVASLGGIVYSTGTAMAILAGTATAGQMLMSGASAAPTWSTNVWANTTPINQILHATAANVIGGTTDFLRLTTGELFLGQTALVAAELFGIQKNQNALTYQTIVNTTSGTAGMAGIFCSNSATLATSISIRSHSALYTTAGINIADTGVVSSSKAAGMNIGTTSATQLSFWTNNTKKVEISSVGNMSLGGVAVRATTVGTNAFQIFDGTAPVGTLANGVSLFSVAGVLKSANAAGLVGFVNSSTDGAAAPATAAIGVILDYFGSSATRVLTTPNSWEIVTINGTVYKRPLYT